MPTPRTTLARFALAALAFGLVAPSRAAVVHGSFTGTLFDGSDGSGVFGAPGSDLINNQVTGTYLYDTSLLAPAIAGTVDTGSGAGGALSVVLTINGQSFTFTDSSGSSVVLDSSTGELDLALTNAVGDDYEFFSLGAIPASNPVSGTDLSQSFTSGPLSSSLGSFVISDPLAQANGDFTLTSISQTAATPTSVPEPASLALLAPLAGALAAACGRPRTRMRHGVEDDAPPRHATATPRSRS